LQRAEEVIGLLMDGKWHSFSEISQEINVHESKIEILTDFLADYSFLQLKKKEKKAKLTKAFEEFLKSIEDLED